MDVSALIRERLAELGLGQKDLAAAAGITESYVSQLLTRKKPPPSPERTDIYEKMEDRLRLPRGKLSELAEHQRIEELRRNVGHVPRPLNKGVRDFVLRKCLPAREPQIRPEFEKDSFGPLERLVTQKLLDVVKNMARKELRSEPGVHLLGRISGISFEEARVTILEFLDTDLINLSAEQCDSFLDPLIESWDIDLVSFGMDIALNRELGPGRFRRLEIVEAASDGPSSEERGLREFLGDRTLSGDATEEEVAFLRAIRFDAQRPTALYYYRELQSLRDPLHFRDRGKG